jgi:transcriptional regulator with XRE-family HTH domain
MVTPPEPNSRPYQVASARALGAGIRYFRRQQGFTQAGLAQRAGMPRETLSRLENGHETEQLRHVFALLRQLGLRATLERVDLDQAGG